MKQADLPVKMYCPFRYIEDTVYFHPVQLNGEWYIDINSFNGCENNWHSCAECENCKTSAYAKIMSQES